MAGVAVFRQLFHFLLVRIVVVRCQRLGTGETSTASASAVIQGKVKLPCNISPTSEDDKTLLVLWYKEDSGKPIFSLDLRGVQPEEPLSFPRENVRSRAMFRPDGDPAYLLIEEVRDDDEGIYRCRVDFQKAPTRNSVVSLSVIVPPRAPTILGEKGLELNSVVGPYNEGSTLFLSCEVIGGRPPPRVTWWRDSLLLDESYEVTSLGIVRNDLVVQPLSRQDFNAVFACRASNSNFTDPVSTFVTVNMNLKPIEIRILNEDRPMSANRRRQFVCQAVGSRPSALITWWKASKRMRRIEETVSRNTNVTTSILTFSPVDEDNGKELVCRAENPSIPGSSIEYRRLLNVMYSPIVSVILKKDEIVLESVSEGDDASLECATQANPEVTKVKWTFKGKLLMVNNASISNSSIGIPLGVWQRRDLFTISLNGISQTHAGIYTCKASNSEGEVESKEFNLFVKHIPFCVNTSQIVNAARNKELQLKCQVEAYPMKVNFRWKFNNDSDFENSLQATAITESKTSILTFIPKQQQDFGTFYCWGTNEIGTQLNPCTIHLIAAGVPDAVVNCSVMNQTNSSLEVICSGGYDGGLTQTFVCEIVDAVTGKLLYMQTSYVPSFHFIQLPSGSLFILSIYASNAGGKSDVVMMMGFTLKAFSDPASSHWSVTLTGIFIATTTASILLGIYVVLRYRIQRNKRIKCKFKAGSRGHEPYNFYPEEIILDEKSPDLIPSSHDQEFPSVTVKCLQPKWAFGDNEFLGMMDTSIGNIAEHRSSRCKSRKVLPMIQET